MGRQRAHASNIDLPKYVYRKRGRYYYETRGPDRKWIPLGTNPLTLWDQVLAITGSADAVVFKALNRVYSRAKERAKRKGRPFLLEWPDMLAMWTRCEGRCEVTGIAFRLDRKEGISRRPYAPSLDRIDSAKPYEKGNCRLVCTAVNIAINEWGVETFAEIAKALHFHVIRTRNYRQKEVFATTRSTPKLVSD